jgi:3-oxoacyl-(acyl-carrier-protein) synthase
MDPDVCRPFADDRAGINIGEGAAFLLIEREGDALVSLASVGETSDAHHMTHPHPDGRGAEGAMRQALEAAQVGPEQIAYINAHGTGTELNDRSEAAAILRVFGNAPRVSSTKSLTGHLLGACGAAEAVLTALAIQHQVAPGNGSSAVASEIQVGIARSNERCRISHALSNSLAFGGSNASVLLTTERAGASAVSGSPCAELVQAIAWRPEPTDMVVPRASAKQILSARARGRASDLTLMLTELLEALAEGGFDTKHSPVVYGSAFGEMKTTLELLELEVQRAESSPLRFQHSVHNTAGGLLSIATGNTGFSTSIAAGNLTFAMSMLEGITYLAHSSQNEVAVIVADEASAPKLLNRRYPATGAAFHLRRPVGSAPGGLVVHAPHRLRSPPPSVTAASTEFGNNPVADSLKLVRAFQSQQPQTIALADHDATGLDAASDRLWVIELSHALAR